jgi:hypothetical protein
MAAIVLGAGWGFNTIFLMWHLLDMGGSKSLLGIVQSVATLTSLPILFYSKQITNKIGETNVITIACIVLALRFLVLAFMTNPWLAVLSEGIGEPFSFNLVFSTLMTMGENLAGNELRATINSTIRTLYFPVGRTLGSFLGGLLMNWLTMRQTFLVIAAILTAGGLLYFFLQRCCINKFGQEVENKKYEAVSQFDSKTTGKANQPTIITNGIQHTKELSSQDNVNEQIEATGDEVTSGENIKANNPGETRERTGNEVTSGENIKADSPGETNETNEIPKQ